MLHEFIRELNHRYGALQIDYNSTEGYVVIINYKGIEFRNRAFSLSYALGLLQTKLEIHFPSD